jgi:hypothetical protein
MALEVDSDEVGATLEETNLSVCLCYRIEGGIKGSSEKLAASEPHRKQAISTVCIYLAFCLANWFVKFMRKGMGSSHQTGCSETQSDPTMRRHATKCTLRARMQSEFPHRGRKARLTLE